MDNVLNLIEFSQGCAETIASVLNVDVTIVDKNCIRVAATGPYKQFVGKALPKGSLYYKILGEGKIATITSNEARSQCSNCRMSAVCKEIATVGYPILMRGSAVGVIGLVAFKEEQKLKINNMPPFYNDFLDKMSNLIGNKLVVSNDTNTKKEQNIKVNNGCDLSKNNLDSILGEDPKFVSVIERARQVAHSTSTILITGESGTGKELLARAIHNDSPRCNNPFVAINCAAIPENLLESELFGYEKGAFTGANKEGKPGKFELAQHGTIFLDEIGDMPLSLQPKLLRVLQERVLDKVGGSRSIPLDIRVIAATNIDLESKAREGHFRQDLYYRLNVIPINIPPLRERSTDIPLYMDFFIKKYSNMLNKPYPKFSSSAKKAFEEYRWEGNIRELENAVEYIVNLNFGEIVKYENLPLYMIRETNDKGIKSLDERVSELEKSILMEYLRDGNSLEKKQLIAEELKISMATLYRKLKKYNFE